MRGTALGLAVAAVAALALASCWRGSSGAPTEPPQAGEPAAAPSGPLPSDPRGPEKRREILAMLQRGSVLVHLDARRPGVTVPPKHRAENDLVLRIGYEMEPPVPDLLVGLDSLSATLTFAGRPFHVIIPWTAVFGAIVEGDEDGTVWNEDVPPELLDASQAP